MTKSIMTEWNSEGFPDNLLVPDYLLSTAYGPESVFNFARLIMGERFFVEKIDLDTGEVTGPSGSLPIEEDGDAIYLIYSNIKIWSYLIWTDLSWGALLSNKEPSKIFPDFDISSAREDFARSFTIRTTSERAYYDVPRLLDWERVFNRN